MMILANQLKLSNKDHGVKGNVNIQISTDSPRYWKSIQESGRNECFSLTDKVLLWVIPPYHVLNIYFIKCKKFIDHLKHIYCSKAFWELQPDVKQELTL